MTEAAKIISFRDIPKTLFRNRLLQGLVVLSVLVEIYNLAVISPYASTQKARETSAVADNAVLRQKAEADLAEAKAVNETEVARNAARRQAAEARKATALAGKTRYEAELARATAAYAEQQAKAETEAQELQADILKQQEQIQSQLNSYIERRKYVEAEEAEANARIQQGTGQMVSGGSRRSEAEKLQECSDKFEELWADYQTVIHITRTSWEGDRIAAKVQLYKARCGFTTEQVQRFQKAQLESLTALEKSYCGSPASYQKEQQQEVAKLLGHMPDCRHYAGLDAQPGNQVVTPSAGAQVAGSASSNQGRLPILRVISEVADGKLNLRDGPGVRHSVIAELPVGTLLRQIGACVHSDDGITRDPWCSVDWNGTKGWASSSGLERGGVPQEPSTPSTGNVGKDGYNKGLEAADRLLGPNSITFGVRAR